MGEQDVRRGSDKGELHQFLKYLLNDLRAFEKMINDGMIESGIRRIGAEQEIFLVDKNWRPAPLANQMLKELDDYHYTNELAKFNIEFNLDPLVYGGDCLSVLEKQVDFYLEKAHRAAEVCGGKVVMTGILPTLNKSDLDLNNMTPNPRYFALNEALLKLRGGTPYQFQIKGSDELNFSHDSLMVEACNTSFQIHFQVSPNEFAKLYNVAQAIAAPVMAAAVNSPILFGKRLWKETRIALFQQSIDTRMATPHMRDERPRVHFGRNWVNESPVEIFREDISKFRAVLSTTMEEDPFEEIANGRAPSLKALRLHNSTIYRWNRICYGVGDGKPHIRIENRILPAGPTPKDEIANSAFWFGLMGGVANELGDIRQHMDFDDALENFTLACQSGINAQLSWAGQKPQPAEHLILNRMLPLAREGLQESKIDQNDIDLYLGIIKDRMVSHRTGSQWVLDSLKEMHHLGTTAQRMNAITVATFERQKTGQPVHEWELAKLEEAGGWKTNYLIVEQYMSTDLITVHKHEPIELLANLMDWNKIRHILVEDDENRLIGLVSHRALIKLLAENNQTLWDGSVSVNDIMKTDPICITPETTTLHAIELMKEEGLSCLPVVKDDHLVGVVTESDFMGIAGELLEQKLKY